MSISISIVNVLSVITQQFRRFLYLWFCSKLDGRHFADGHVSFETCPWWLYYVVRFCTHSVKVFIEKLFETQKTMTISKIINILRCTTSNVCQHGKRCYLGLSGPFHLVQGVTAPTFHIKLTHLVALWVPDVIRCGMIYSRCVSNQVIVKNLVFLRKCITQIILLLNLPFAIGAYNMP